MKIQFIKIDDITPEQWSDLVKESSTANFFQTRKCYDFFDSLSFMEAFVFGVEEDNILKGVVVGYIQKDGGKIKQFLSRRAIITGGPMFADDISDEAISQLLLNTKKQLKRKVIYIETRNFNDYSKYKDTFDKCGFEYVAHLNFHVDCSSIEVFNKNLSRNIKRNVKSAIGEGVKILTDVTLSDVNEFYNILYDAYYNKIKSPIFPLSFFQELYNQPFVKYIIIKREEEIIGGMCLLFDARTVYAYYACGKDDIYRKCYPSTVANYQSILYATENNFRRFDFMGAGKPNEEYGVRDFKAKFGGELVEHGRFLCVVNALLYNLGKQGIKLLKKI